MRHSGGTTMIADLAIVLGTDMTALRRSSKSSAHGGFSHYRLLAAAAGQPESTLAQSIRANAKRRNKYGKAGMSS